MTPETKTEAREMCLTLGCPHPTDCKHRVPVVAESALSALRAEHQRTTREIEANLEVIAKRGGKVVRVRENGGPEDLFASLAVSVAALLNQLAEVTKERDEAFRNVDLDVEHAEAIAVIGERDRLRAALAASEEKAREMREALEAEERVGFSINAHDTGLDHYSPGTGGKTGLESGCAKCIADDLRKRALSPSPAPRVGAESEGRVRVVLKGERPEDPDRVEEPAWEPEVPNFSDGDEASDE